MLLGRSAKDIRTIHFATLTTFKDILYLTLNKSEIQSLALDLKGQRLSCSTKTSIILEKWTMRIDHMEKGVQSTKMEPSS